jgi:hypothetical protein
LWARHLSAFSRVWFDLHRLAVDFVSAAIALIYSGPAIINVGPSRVFNDIVSAYATISGKLLLAPVTIQVRLVGFPVCKPYSNFAG